MQVKERWQRLHLRARRAITELGGRIKTTHAAEACPESDAHYRQLFKSEKEGIVILNHDDGRIMDVNPYLINMLDYSREQLVGKRIWETNAFKNALSSKSAFAELKGHGRLRTPNLSLERRDGTVRQVEFVGIISHTGSRSLIQCNIRDVTHGKHYNEALLDIQVGLEQAREELKAKSHELACITQQLWQASKLVTMGELAACVAHELNNPLATVALRAESAMKGLLQGDPRRHALEIILQEVERMSDLVGTLLQFSRRNDPQTRSTDLAVELKKALEFIEYYLRSHHIDVIQRFAGQLPTIQADRQKLFQVFINLATNACDAMPGGGSLTVTTYVSTFAVDRSAVVIEFSDTGNGVEMLDLSGLWEPFFTTKPEGKGTGLGLAICRRMIEEHRGTIEIEPRPEKGLTVRITLPAADRGVAIAA